MTKRKHKKKSTKRKTSKQQAINYKLLNSLLAIIIVLILAIVFILYTTDTKRLKESKKITEKVEKTIKQEINKVEQKSRQELDQYIKKVEIKKDEFEEYTKDLYEEYVDKEEKHKVEKEIHKELETKVPENKPKEKTDNFIKLIEEKKSVKIEKKIEVKDKPLPTITNRPKLAIVIDDVTTQYQLNQIKKIPYVVTPSFMPPVPNHPHSAKIAKNLPFYMIHFPLEASTFKSEENNTLHINDSYERIEKRVAQIRKWYPNAKYTNNHTGSKFTEHEKSMDKLFRALIKYDFIFVDSRTSGKTVGKQMAKKYKMPYIVRNVFLDNEQDFAYIQNQLKKAIRIAKKMVKQSLFVTLIQ
ncbi:MAG: hypothetical protein C0625_09150 [Arcobacter sp.]|nr:MAG: hypothetical protein C0625_09150 [Arcobacter sp.]